jgi:RNA polymerase sigma factor (sigma-70 family)
MMSTRTKKKVLTREQQQLVSDNIGLVYSIVDKEMHRLRKCGWTNLTHEHFEDLCSNGYIGICNAALYYKPEQGTAFSTYAYHAIQNELYRAEKNGVLLSFSTTWNGENEIASDGKLEHQELAADMLVIVEHIRETYENEELPENVLLGLKAFLLMYETPDAMNIEIAAKMGISKQYLNKALNLARAYILQQPWGKNPMSA